LTHVQPQIGVSAPPEFLRADPRARRIVIVALVIFAFAGTAAIEWLLPRLSALAAAGQISRKSICIGFLVFLMVFVVPVVLAGIENLWLGRNAVQSAQFPSQKTRVLVDVRITRGARAITLGKLQQLLGIFLVLAGFALLCIAGFGVYALW
jgi:hypothetical protein